MAETEEKLESASDNEETTAALADGNEAPEQANATNAPENGEPPADPAPPPDGPDGAEAPREATQPEGEEAQESKDVAQDPEDAAQSPAPDGGCEAKALVDSAVQRILEAFASLQESFDGKLRYDAKKDAIIDRQFQELTQFKSGLVEKVTMQIIGDLIGEIDSAQKLVKFYETAECNEANFRKMQKVLRDIPASLCDVLEKYGVTSYSSKAGAPFNPKRQKALKTTETGDASKDKTVRELLRLGFEQELEAKDDQPTRTKVLRSEMVDVFVFNPALAEPAAEPKNTEPQEVGQPQSTAEEQAPTGQE